MTGFSFSSLRSRLFFLVLLAVIPALALTLYNGLEQRQHAAAHVQEEALRLARLASTDQERMIHGVHQFLHTIAQLPQVRNCDKVACFTLFTDLRKQYPHYLNIGAAELNGNVFASAVPLVQKVNIADRPYFQHAFKTRNFSIGEYQIGRIVGKPTVNFGYPVIAETGEVKAVVYVALDLTWLNHLIAEPQLPEGSTLMLIDHNCNILAHNPDPEKWVGKAIPESPLVKTILAQGEGVSETIGLDGVSRLYAFTSFGGIPKQDEKIYVSIGIPASVIFAPVKRVLVRNLALLGLVTLLALMGAWLIGNLLIFRQVNALLSATKRVSAGDLSVRTGIPYQKGELNQLAQAFDEMANSLQNREAEHKQAQEALKKEKEKAQEYLDIAGVMLMAIHADQKVSLINRKGCEVLGYGEEEITGKNWFDNFLPVRLGNEVKAVFSKLVAGEIEAIEYFENPVLTKSGKERMIAWHNTIISDEKGNIVGTLSSGEDITDRKKAEESLKKNEEEAKRLAHENSIMAEIGRIISSSLNIDEVYERFIKEVGKLISFDRIVINVINIENETTAIAYAAGTDIPSRQIGVFIPLAGTATEECMRITSSMLIQPDDIEECLGRFPALSPTFGAGLRSIIFVPLISKDQFIGALSLRSFKPKAYGEQDLRLAEKVANQIAGAVANAQLFAERLRAEEKARSLEEQLLQSQKMEAIGRLAGGIAHDFNNLMTIVKGYSQLSLLKLKEGDSLKTNIEEIQRAADRAANLTHQLLAFSRRQILEFKVLDLNAILRNLDKMLRRIIGEDIELTYQLSDDLGKIKTDPGQIEQVILNLAVNARDAMPSGGKLTIETANAELKGTSAHTGFDRKPGRYVLLSVSDTGHGMSLEIKEHLFEPFFTTKEVGKGTGLGLSTAYGIVKQSEGDIWVYSEPGKGTTFKIYLPRVEEEVNILPHQVDKGFLPQGRETVLLVEDEGPVRRIVARVLREKGYTLLEAPNGNEALRMAQKYDGEIHLLLTDVVMPQMGGKELSQKMKTLQPNIKVLFTSGYTDDAISHHGVLNPGVEFLWKPFSPEGLVQKVREVLDQ